MADDDSDSSELPSPRRQYPEPSYIIASDKLKDDFAERLARLKSAGSLAMSDVFPQVPSPGIRLENGHVIQASLPYIDSQAIITASRDALVESGESEEDIAFTEVKKKWELSLDTFELENPDWDDCVNSIVASLSFRLGIDATGEPLSADLDKLMLYEEGAVFQPTEDVEHYLGTFATLVIALPSEQDEEEEIYLVYEGQIHRFPRAHHPDSEASYSTWFRNATDVKPFTAHRLLLTYDLTHSTLNLKQWTINFKDSVASLSEILSRWKTPLAFVLEHRYKDADLRYGKLRGCDKQIISVLRDVCKSSGYCLYLSDFYREVKDAYHDDGNHDPGHIHPIIRASSTSSTLIKIAALDGIEVASRVSFDEGTFVPSRPFKGVDRDYEGWSSYGSPRVTHIYSRTIAVVVPNKDRVDFCFPIDRNTRVWGHHGMNSQILSWMDRATARLAKNNNDTEARDDLEQISRMVIRNGTDEKTKDARVGNARQFSDEVYSRNLKIALDIDEKNVFIEAYRNRAGKACVSLCRSLGAGLLRYDLVSLLPDVADMLSTVKSLSIRLKMIEQLRQGLSAETRQSSKDVVEYLNWLKSEISRTLSSDDLEAESIEDGCGLANFAIEASNQQIFDTILQVVKKNVMNTSMAVSFLVNIFEAGQSGQIPENVSQALFKDVFSDLVGHFTACGLRSSLYQRASDPPISYTFDLDHEVHADTALDKGRTTSRWFALLICYSLSLGLEDDLHALITNMILDTVPNHLCAFESIYLPTFCLLGPMLQERKYLIQDSSIAKLVRSILIARIVNYAKAEPVPSDDWKRRKVSCTCRDCSHLNTFLVDATQHVWRFAASQRRRTHVQNSLLSHVENYNIETERFESLSTMVVTKNKVRYFALHQAWVTRCEIVKKDLQSLDQDFLQLCFGEEYDAIVSIKMDVILPAHKKLVASVLELAEKDPPSRVPSPISKRKVPAQANSSKKSPEKAQV